MARAKRPASTAAKVSESETGGTLIVDLAAIAANWRALARRLRAAECGAVVKADGYGLGLASVTATLAKAGCKTFFVADLAEARTVRAHARQATIYVLNGFAPDWAPAFARINARPVINSAAELAEWDAFVAARRWKGGAALHVDTGMNRLGLSPADAIALAPRAQKPNHGFTLLMSHLACAEIPQHPLNARQIALFRQLHGLYPGVPASLANSSGIFLSDATHFDMARPGAALYGINPTPCQSNPVKPVVEFKGRILQIRHVEPEETVGYDATWTAPRPSRIAVVALGYADGLMRGDSRGNTANGRAGGSAVIAGQRCPIVGRISMDLTCVDITDAPPGAIHRGDMATLIGNGITLDEMAESAGTIGYEILTRLGPRCHRIYRSGRGS
jgi:alanine racemase